MSLTRWYLARIATWWLFSFRGYRDGAFVHGRIDRVMLGVRDWALAYRIAPFWRLVRAQWQYAARESRRGRA